MLHFPSSSCSTKDTFGSFPASERFIDFIAFVEISNFWSFKQHLLQLSSNDGKEIPPCSSDMVSFTCIFLKSCWTWHLEWMVAKQKWPLDKLGEAYFAGGESPMASTHTNHHLLYKSTEKWWHFRSWIIWDDPSLISLVMDLGHPKAKAKGFLKRSNTYIHVSLISQEYTALEMSFAKLIDRKTQTIFGGWHISSIRYKNYILSYGPEASSPDLVRRVCFDDVLEACHSLSFKPSNANKRLEGAFCYVVRPDSVMW